MTMDATNPKDVTRPAEPEDPESALRDARQRFIAAFPKRSDSIGLLLGMVSAVGARGPVEPLVQVVHRTAGLAGTLGFPTVSKWARELEELLDTVGRGAFDVSRANAIFDAIEEAFTTDLSNPPAWSSTAPPAGTRQRIMLVEDDEDQREVVAIHLRAAGYQPILVPTGDVALEAAREHHPDVILLDANLPGLDGYSICRLLKTDPDLSRTPVMFMTVRGNLDDKIVGLMLGADDYLTKPVDMTELVLRIQLQLSRKATHDAAQYHHAGRPTDDPGELDFESFTAVAREQLALYPATLALIRVPEMRLMEAYSALRADSRRRDIVACYDPSHLIMLLVEMPLSKARERLTDVIARLAPGDPPKFQVGIAYSAGAGVRSFEALLAESDEAVVVARQKGLLLAVAGENAPLTATAHLTKGKVVLADDDPEVSRLIDAQLRSAGYETVLTSDGIQAMAAIEQHRPDLVIIDMMMPRMTGFDVLTRLRHQPARPRIIVLSARGRAQDVTRAFALGADDYMTKPFSPQELLARLERLMR
ncbi:MAG: response regulator transcription factor [Acidobacteriota bacterium]